MRTWVVSAGLAVLLGVGLGPAEGQEGASVLPGGASSLQETYEDWRVACTVQGGVKRCSLSQQHNRQDGQRVLGIDLAPAQSGGVTGTLVLPFGLRLDAGVTLKIDEQSTGEALRFSTCLPAGCIVLLERMPLLCRPMRDGETLKLVGTINDSGQPLALSVSLRGFAAGIDRTDALLR